MMPHAPQPENRRAKWPLITAAGLVGLVAVLGLVAVQQLLRKWLVRPRPPAVLPAVPAE